MNDQDDLILPATVDELIKLLNKVYPEKSAFVTEQLIKFIFKRVREMLLNLSIR